MNLTVSNMLLFLNLIWNNDFHEKILWLFLCILIFHGKSFWSDKGWGLLKNLLQESPIVPKALKSLRSLVEWTSGWWVGGRSEEEDWHQLDIKHFHFLSLHWSRKSKGFRNAFSLGIVKMEGLVCRLQLLLFDVHNLI